MKIWIGLGLFLLGVVIGAAGSLLGPHYVEPYMPKFLQQPKVEIEGIVVRKQLESDRVLITVSSRTGSTLAIFDERVNEIEMLVQEGDLMTLRVNAYEPFVTNPEIASVKQSASGTGSAPISPNLELEEIPLLPQSSPP